MFVVVVVVCFSIIESLGIFSDLFTGTQNSSTFSFTKFALQIEDNFRGQYFCVHLGTVEEARAREDAIDPNSLKVSDEEKTCMEKWTALVGIPENYTSKSYECGRKDTERFSFFVFITNILFQTKSNTHINSVVVSVRVASACDQTLTDPVSIQFSEPSNFTEIVSRTRYN